MPDIMKVLYERIVVLSMNMNVSNTRWINHNLTKPNISFIVLNGALKITVNYIRNAFVYYIVMKDKGGETYYW